MENSTEYIERIDELIYRFLTGQSTPYEVSELRSWIKSNPEHKLDFERYHAIWFLVKRSSRYTEYKEEIAWEDLKKHILDNKISGSIIPLRRFRVLGNLKRIAAIFIFAFSSGSLAVYIFKGDERKPVVGYTEQKVPRGAKTYIILPDSSSVWLNSGSSLKYSTAFNEQTREVYLEGEAFFDVKKKNNKKPFFVRTHGVSVKVLGTAFNVKAYPNEKVETTVQRGLVQVLSNDDKAKKKTNILLHPNQKATFELEKEEAKLELPQPIAKTPVCQQIEEEAKELKLMPAVVEEVDAAVAASWKDKRWIISHEDLKSLAVKISRRFDVELIFLDESIQNYFFSGILEDENLEQVLQLIKLSAPIEFMVHQKKVTLYEKKQ